MLEKAGATWGGAVKKDRARGQILETVRIGFSCHQSLPIMAKENEYDVATGCRGLRFIRKNGGKPQLFNPCEGAVNGGGLLTDRQGFLTAC
jgi:hypothetical protein